MNEEYIEIESPCEENGDQRGDSPAESTEKPIEREECFLCHKAVKVNSCHEGYSLIVKFPGKTYKKDFCSVECLQEFVEGLV